jgi:serine protease Do
MAYWFVPIIMAGLTPCGQSADALDGLRASQRALARAVERATPWVVAIQTVGDAPTETDSDAPRTSPTRTGFRRARGPTTGLIVSPDGWIITSSFGFARSPAVVTVRLADGRRFVARPLANGRLLARDRIRKLALIKIDAEDLPAVEWTELDALRVGQWAVALGRGHGGDTPAVSVGIVSALRRHSGLAVQTDALLSPANYGGPLIDLDGRAIGVCVPMGLSFGQSAGVELYDSGVGFCISSRQVADVLDRLRAGQDIVPGRIGVLLASADQGALIRAVADPSPARSAGLQAGDRILTINGLEVKDVGHLQRLLRPRAAGEHIRLSVRGEDQEARAITLRLVAAEDIGELPAGEEEAPIRITTQPAPGP